VTSGVAQTAAESAVMASTAAKFDTVNQQLTSMLNNLMSNLSTLQGLAAGEFEKVKTQYAADLNQLNKALAETAEAIRTSGTNYDTTDSAAAARVGKSGGGGFNLPL
jgi:WXG100 family type VII secretion target